MWILQKRRASFSEAFFKLHQRRTKRMLLWAALQFSIASTLAGIGFWQLFYGPGILFPGLFTSTFLVMMVSTVWSTVDQFRVRVIPYYERKLGDVDTWPTGKSLLAHSRDLDELTRFLGLPALSEFVSGDDLVQGEQLAFFPAEKALPTVEKLILRSKASRFSKELLSDLISLRDALKVAAVRNVRFCLLLREGSGVNAQEMALRQGSFF
jgi:hypothetical protein